MCYEWSIKIEGLKKKLNYKENEIGCGNITLDEFKLMRIIFENDSFLTHDELNNPKSHITFKIQGMKFIYLGLKSPTCLKLGLYVG